MINEAVSIRKEVFIDEQGFDDEFDEIDELCSHAIAYLDDLAIGTCRFYEQSPKTYFLGRVAVKKAYRKKNYGRDMLCDVEKYIKNAGGEKIILHAQLSSRGFYEKQGFTAGGTIDYEQDCPHVWMSKELI